MESLKMYRKTLEKIKRHCVLPVIELRVYEIYSMACKKLYSSEIRST